MRKYFALIALIFGFFGNAQILNPVQWKTKVVQKSATEFELVMDATIENEWHMYSQFTPENGPLPTVFNYKNAKGNFDLVGKTKESPYKKVYNDIFEVDEYYFAKTAQFKQIIKVTNTKLKEVKVYVEYQVCKEQCIQQDATFTFKLPELKVEDTAATNVISTDTTTITTDTATVERADAEKPIKEVTSTLAPNEEKKNGWLLFLATLLAGILVTFTPCVFPMIPMTVSFFLKQSAHGDKKKGRFNALMYGFFIVLIYVLISLPFHIFEGISEDIFYEVSTNPYLNLFFFAVFTIFAISFLGAFEITIPSSLANKVDNASNKGGLIGIFFMALTLIIVSFSCTGPALGLVIGGALSTDGGATLLTIAMLGFGVGLAFPFMIFALFPSMMGNLPKSGGWLNTVKVVFGFIELALAFKFFSMADLVMDWHILERETFIAIWVALFLGLALYLFGKITLPHDSPLSHISVGRLLLGLLSLTFAVYLIPGLWGAPLNVISGFPPPMSYSESPNGVGAKNSIESNISSGEELPEHAQYGPHKIVAFHDYDEGLAYAKKVNKPVLIDFTGVTCVNCRRMEELVWAKPEILNILKNDVVLISLYVDDRKELPKDEVYTTKSGKEITTYGKKWSDLAITKYKANIQPYYILMSHDESNLNQPVGYTPDVEEYKKWLEDGVAAFKK
ncbi:protein-disulfide reductase DsbD family protein [Flavobacterium cheniae]|uniref:Thiol:disulfide interchange protein DsbD n=1 Tax=Flavobacterium cheniae TaxID=295428 RepID=A0A562KSK0_9FLAO|nr:thioredoxin family protein [Flavobacterium cheniae]TDR25433.1 thiol:disulfide interchange protein DsbD [Flavobacterium cheniae]TWH98380.1 thiol:disulfide interchange protein DsbD [Flavobacterium cheniae]